MKPKVWPYFEAAFKPFKPVYHTIEKVKKDKRKDNGGNRLKPK